MDIEAPITAVTVYTDRARITRKGRARLEAGAGELIVPGLPPNIDPDSLRATGRGSVGVQLIGVESRERPLLESPHQAARELQDELEQAGSEGKALVQRDEALAQRLETVKQLADNASRRYAASLARGETSLESTAQLLDFVASQTNEINAARQALDKARRENASRQAALQSRLAQLQGARAKSDRCVAVLIEAQGAGEWDLELSYEVRAANWKPLYDARVALPTLAAQPTGVPEATLSLGYGALLTQQTGEDWSDVRLTLSTARPGLGSLPPKLEPIYVDVERPVVYAAAMSMPAPMMRSRKAGRADAEDLETPVFRGGAADDEEPIEAEEVMAEVETSGATVTFNLPHPLSVPSDGQPHRASIAIEEFPCKLDYHAVPRRASLAFLRAVTENSGSLTLLEGEANIFRDGVFVGKTHLKATAPGQELSLFLGPDEQVKAERELTARETDKNFIGNQKRTHYAYAIDLHNAKPHPAKVTVLDQIPVSRSEQIKIKLRGAEPAPQVSDLNILKWELTLAAGEKRRLRYDFGVEAPRETNIVGLHD